MLDVDVKCPRCGNKMRGLGLDKAAVTAFRCGYCNEKFETCDICDSLMDATGYGESACPKCGQVYQYDECARIVLTDEQWKLLREHWTVHERGV